MGYAGVVAGADLPRHRGGRGRQLTRGRSALLPQPQLRQYRLGLGTLCAGEGKSADVTAESGGNSIVSTKTHSIPGRRITMNIVTHCFRRLFFLIALTILAATAQAANQCVPPPSGIIAWWPLDETEGNLASDRVGTHLGAYVGNPVASPGKVGGALGFDGTNYVDVPDSDAWAFGASDFTIELWASLSAEGGGSLGHPSHIFIGNDEGPGGVPKWFFALGGGQLEFHFTAAEGPQRFLAFGGFSPSVGQWHHLAVTRKGNEWRAFIDGVQLGAVIVDDAVIINPDAPLTMGQAEQIGFMAGHLDEVSIYHRALAQAELQAIANAGAAGKCKEMKIQPQAGGDIGTVSVRITGSGFVEGMTVKLKKDGQTDIEGTSVNAGNGGTTLNATFDLAGKPRGVWDVVITRPDNSVATLPGGFAIEEGRAPKIWVDIVGLNLIRQGRPQTFHVFYGNTGNINGAAYLAIRGIPKSSDVKVNFGRIVDSLSQDLMVNNIRTHFIDYKSERMIPVDIYNISAGSTGSISLNIKLRNLPGSAFSLLTTVMKP